MSTQTIKGWFQKLFAWWPWKQSATREYRHVASVTNRGSLPETTSWSTGERTAPQSGLAPCLSTLEDHAEPTAQLRAGAFDPSPLPTSTSSLSKEKESALDAGDLSPRTPTTRQRLEFLRYLVQRNIVNEGFEKPEADDERPGNQG